MNKIPISFEFQGKLYNGSLEEVYGSGGDQWHLVVDNYYWGRLRGVGDSWYFDGAKFQPGDSLIDYFASVVIAWYQ